jgi:hypothetical protein
MFRRVALLALAAAFFVFPLGAEASIHCDRWASSALPLEVMSHGTDWLCGNVEWEAGILKIVATTLGHDAKPKLWLMPTDLWTYSPTPERPFEFSGRSWDSLLFSSIGSGRDEVPLVAIVTPTTGPWGEQFSGRL